MDLSLTSEERKTLLRIARETIQARLGVRPSTRSTALEMTQALSTPCGAFVTLHKNGRLRGCIGHITSERPLHETIREVAAASALEDPRFPALSRDEIAEVDLEISVLSPLRRIVDPGQIEPGTHGILLRSGAHSGLLLPQVATEQGWDRETFLEHTCLKAGVPRGAWRSTGTEIEIFTAIVFGEERE